MDFKIVSGTDLRPLDVIPVLEILIFGGIWLYSQVFQKPEATILEVKMASDIDFRSPSVIPVAKILILGTIWLFFYVFDYPEPVILDFKMASDVDFLPLGASRFQKYLYSLEFDCFPIFPGTGSHHLEFQNGNRHLFPASRYHPGSKNSHFGGVFSGIPYFPSIWLFFVFFRNRKLPSWIPKWRQTAIFGLWA